MFTMLINITSSVNWNMNSFLYALGWATVEYSPSDKMLASLENGFLIKKQLLFLELNIELVGAYIISHSFYTEA